MVENVVRLLTLVLAIVALIAVMLHLSGVIALTEGLFGTCCMFVGWGAAPPAQMVALVKTALGQLKAKVPS